MARGGRIQGGKTRPPDLGRTGWRAVTAGDQPTAPPIDGSVELEETAG
jgi:hypothetical protein